MVWSIDQARAGWSAERLLASTVDEAVKLGGTHVGDDWHVLIRHPQIDIVVECTGNPLAAVDHCPAAFAQCKHLVKRLEAVGREGQLFGSPNGACRFGHRMKGRSLQSRLRVVR